MSAGFGVALLGAGNVGLAAYQLLQKCGAPLQVKQVVVRDVKKAAAAGISPALLGTDFERAFGDPSVKVIVELLGGVEQARALVLRAIDRGLHVVTANKALLAAHGEEIFSRAAAKNVDVRFEGAVCGGLPIIRTLREALASDRVQTIAGIINGTTNFILSAMEEGGGYGETLKEAQRLGFAEADPTLDVEGLDAAQKLQLLATLAFKARLTEQSVRAEGITKLTPADFAWAKEHGYAIKLIGLARREGSGALELGVRPTLLSRRSPLAEVRGAFNAVLIQSEALGASLLYGKGAGGLATASAVVSDLLDVARDLNAGVTGRVPMPQGRSLEDVALSAAGERVGRNYLRFTVADEPGVLGKIASVLGEENVSLAAVDQRPPPEGQKDASIAVSTHRARESDVRSALAWVDQLSTTRAPTQLIPIEEGL